MWETRAFSRKLSQICNAVNKEKREFYMGNTK